MPKLMQGLAVPFGMPTAIAEIDPDGKRRIYAEQFDAESFAALPQRVPFIRSHQRANPLGWAALESRDEGLIATISPIDGSTAAADAVAEVASEVMTSLSVGFLSSPDDDLVDTRDRAALPLIRRRGVRLLEISLVDRGAYRSARIYAADLDRWTHEQSEKELAPYRRQKEHEIAARRAEDAALLRRLDEQAGVSWQEKGGVGSPEKGGVGFSEKGVVGSADALGTRESYVVLTRSGAWCRVSRSVARDELDAVEEAEWIRARAEDVARRYGVDEHTILRRFGIEVLT